MAENSRYQRGLGRPFQPGQSGNPGGRPKAESQVTELARQRGPKAFERLCELMRSENPTVALRACEAVLDRAYGKPRQAVEVSSGTPVEIVVTRRIVSPGESA